MLSKEAFLWIKMLFYINIGVQFQCKFRKDSTNSTINMINKTMRTMSGILGQEENGSHDHHNYCNYSNEIISNIPCAQHTWPAFTTHHQFQICTSIPNNQLYNIMLDCECSFKTFNWNWHVKQCGATSYIIYKHSVNYGKWKFRKLD